MAKEVLKLGEIICSIDSEQSYRKMRNPNTDFTLATEKPRLKSGTNCTKVEKGWSSCASQQPEVAIRVNSLGAEILQLCTARNSIEDIAYELSDRYDFDDDLFLEQVKTFLNIFKTYNLLETIK